ncbi:hypothetical protein BC835DRAFT_448965 [Cytidiella melzeri]|nr:hypothetical protein BC835DRAFT_448965 [Cytidiella melzeri]
MFTSSSSLFSPSRASFVVAVNQAEDHCDNETCTLVGPIRLEKLGDYRNRAYGRDNVRDVAAAKHEALVAQSPHATTLRCRFCEGNKPRVFMRKRVTAFDLGRRLRVHLCKEHKPYQCQYPGCDHVDTQEYNMNMHVSKHANRSFSCKQCGKSWRNPSALYRHRKQHEHSGESTRTSLQLRSLS